MNGTTSMAVDGNGRDELDVCAVAPIELSDVRFWLVGFVGPLCSIVGVVENGLLFYSLIIDANKRRSHFLYLTVLALNEAFLCWCYVPVITMDMMRQHIPWVWLMRFWWPSVGPVLTAAGVAMTSSIYLIMLASFERFLITSKSALIKVVRRRRNSFIAITVILAILAKGPTIFEVEMSKSRDNCTGAMEFEPNRTTLARSFYYGTIYKFYFRNLVTIFLPFFTMLYFNIRIVNTLRQQSRKAKMFRFGSTEHKQKVRAATRTLVLVVCGYLVSNVLNVVVTAWEHIDLNSILAFYTFYQYSTDFISLFAVLMCALRLPMYWLCNEEIKTAILLALPTTVQHWISKASRQHDGHGLYSKIERKSRGEEEKEIGTNFDKLALALAVRMAADNRVDASKREAESVEVKEDVCGCDDDDDLAKDAADANEEDTDTDVGAFWSALEEVGSSSAPISQIDDVGDPNAVLHLL